MKFLEKFGFEKKDIEALKENSTSALIKELEAHKKLVSKNLEYLKTGKPVIAYKIFK